MQQSKSILLSLQIILLLQTEFEAFHQMVLQKFD